MASDNNNSSGIFSGFFGSKDNNSKQTKKTVKKEKKNFEPKTNKKIETTKKKELKDNKKETMTTKETKPMTIKDLTPKTEKNDTESIPTPQKKIKNPIDKIPAFKIDENNQTPRETQIDKKQIE
ncbi:MAG: hypothetical protein GQ477_06095, partial [Nanohaloarchaea archaeon]|nr:hypothetical protein [Candidatus Nanohaloarchaea archaeon]